LNKEAERKLYVHTPKVVLRFTRYCKEFLLNICSFAVIDCHTGDSWG